MNVTWCISQKHFDGLRWKHQIVTKMSQLRKTLCNDFSFDLGVKYEPDMFLPDNIHPYYGFDVLYN